MKTSIATVSLPGDLGEKLAAIAAAGFDGVEICENDLLASRVAAGEAGRMAREVGLVVTLFQPFRDFEGMPEPQRSHAFALAERKFDVMQQLGTELILVCSNVSPLSQGGLDRSAADLHELGERAARRGLRIGYEALSWGRHVHDHRDAWEIVRRADHSCVGLILDSFHTLSCGIDPATIRAIPGERIFMVQIADAPRLDIDFLTWSRRFRTMPGRGDLAIGDFMDAAVAAGYDGYYGLEIFNDRYRPEDGRMIALDGRRSLLAAVEGAMRRKTGGGEKPRSG